MSSPKANLVKLNNGNTIPEVGLGVFLTPKDTARKIVYNALDVGYRHIDGAVYYLNEQEVCEGISQWCKDTGNKREDIFYTTKIPNHAHGYQESKAEIEKSLEKAKSIGYIDLILIHAPLSNTERRKGTWKALEEFYESGKVKNIGVSNYGIGHLKEILTPEFKVKPVINQIELHPWLTRDELVEFCNKNDILLEAFSPLARGMKLGENSPPLIKELSKKYGVTDTQILLKWSLMKGFIPLPKTESRDRAITNIDLYSFEISKDDFEKISGLNENWVTWSQWDPSSLPVEDDAFDPKPWSG